MFPKLDRVFLLPKAKSSIFVPLTFQSVFVSLTFQPNPLHLCKPNQVYIFPKFIQVFCPCIYFPQT